MPSARLVAVLSPAKTLELSTSHVSQCSQPRLLAEAHELIEQLQKLSQAKVKSLLGVSDALAKLNYDRYQNFETLKIAPRPSGTLKQAALAFNGPAYQGLEAYNLSESDREYAQTHLRILCGLYGILRPLDLIQPYRLEMGQKVTTNRGKDLYAFWGDKLVSELEAVFSEEEAKDNVKAPRVLINLASQEYFKSLPPSALQAAGISVVHCVFKDDGKIKSVYAKRARGLMCRYLIQKRVDSLEALTGFDLEGYKYSSSASKEDTCEFNRSATEQKVAMQMLKAKRHAAVKHEAEEHVHVAEKKRQLRHTTRKKRKTV